MKLRMLIIATVGMATLGIGLLLYRTSLGRSPNDVFAQVRLNHTERVRRLLLHEPTAIRTRDAQGRAPIHHILFLEPERRVGMIDVFAEIGDLDLLDREGLTLMHYLVIEGDTRAVMTLCDHDANMNIAAPGFGTPLEVAINNDRHQIAALLRKRSSSDRSH